MRKLRNSELNRLSIQEFKSASKLPITVVLDNIRSHHNVGSIFRTCDALRVNKVVLGGITPQPPHAEIEKTALGATESVEWEWHEELAVFFHRVTASRDSKIIALEHTNASTSILHFNLDPQTHYYLIFGNEVKGIETNLLELANSIIEIPQFGTKHSFNVSVSAGIAIWEFAKKFVK